MLSAVRAACAATNLLELHRLATTIETWWPEILAFLHTGITNAGSEGTNRVIKTIARNAYGFRNPEINASAPARRPPAATADTSTPLNFEEPVSDGRQSSCIVTWPGRARIRKACLCPIWQAVRRR